MTGFDPKKIQRETDWLIKYPWFTERPAGIVEFLGPGYLNIEALIRPGLRQALIDIFGTEPDARFICKNFEAAMFTGAIGIGKTTFASIALPYMVHWVLCLENPQEYFELLPGSRIAFMQMSTSEKQATGVVFGDIFARIKNSEWFANNYPHDPKFEKQIKFPKDIWILPGGSLETSFEGYNILGGILDEMDSHKQTEEKDYADVGYDAINSRIASRFPIFGDDGMEAGHKGLIICIGQMKKGNGFAARKMKELQQNPKAYVWRQTIWESFGWERYTDKRTGKRNSFWYDTKRKKIIPDLAVPMLEKVDHVMEIPNTYRNQFETNPEKALRDLAGIPPAASDPFISLVDRVEECREKWIQRYTGNHDMRFSSWKPESPVGEDPHLIQFAPWFRSNSDPRKRHVHIDLGYSADGDALGLAMGHIDSLVEIENELKPYIVFDALMRMHAPPGQEILIQDVRRIVYELREDRGFRIYSVSMDGFQSTDSLQQFRKKRYISDYLSVDRSTLPYEDLRDAIYERRIEFPPYITHLRLGDTDTVEIAIKELLELQYTGKKIDHPPQGSKDVADAMAGVTTTLMSDREYRKGVRSARTRDFGHSEEALQPDGTTGMGMVLPFPGMGSGLKAPLPPQGTGGIMGLSIPNRLKPKGK
jgi:hypothetical protein